MTGRHATFGFPIKVEIENVCFDKERDKKKKTDENQQEQEKSFEGKQNGNSLMA